MLPVKTILRIMSLQGSPEELPYSRPLLSRLVLLYIVSGMFVLVPGANDLFTAIILMGLDLLLLTGFIYFCLYTRNNLLRLQKTLAACFGTGIVFQLLALPLVFAISAMPENSQGGSAATALFFLLMVSWQMAVLAHILRHAMDMVIGLTLLLSVTYLLLSLYLSDLTAALLAAS